MTTLSSLLVSALFVSALGGGATAGVLALPLAILPNPTKEICEPASPKTPPPGPLRSIHAHLAGFHFYSGDLKRTVLVEHYCAQPTAEVMQCAVYDTDQPDARLIGIEYIISEQLFTELPAAEKKLWHSHRYEVMSGLLTAPGLTAEAELELMKMFVTTYGKTWTLWQVDRGDKIPLGLPQLMMGFTADGQVDPKVITERDRARRIDSAEVKRQRAGLPTRPVAAGADGWQQGRAFQISEKPVPAVDHAPRP